MKSKELPVFEGCEIDPWNRDLPLWLRVAAWIGTLDVMHGALIGQPFDLQDFQIDLIRAVCDPAFEHICLSIARGNGKTALIGAITACGIAGPLITPNTEIPVVATNKEQAAIAVKHAYWFLRDHFINEPLKYKYIENEDKGFKIRNLHDNVKAESVSADPRSKHGGSPRIAIEDEPAQWVPGSAEKVHNAIMDSRGKQHNSCVLTIGTQADSEYHFFNRALKVGMSKDGRKAGIWARLYAADANAKFDDWHQIRKANPLVELNPDLKATIEKGIEEIKTGARSEAPFKAYRLNMGTSELANREYIFGDKSLEIWKSCVLDGMTLDAKHPRSGIYFVAIDTGEGKSLTAVTFYWPETGRFEAYAAVPMGKITLEEREVEDKNIGVYTAAREAGILREYPRMTVPIDKFTEWIFELAPDGEKPEAIFADSYKEDDVTQGILELGEGWKSRLEIRRIGGGKDGRNDINGFVKEVFDGHLKCVNNPLMLAAIKDAEIRRDTNDNPQLIKGRDRGRIDVLQAGIMAVGAGYRSRKKGGLKRKRRAGSKSYVF